MSAQGPARGVGAIAPFAVGVLLAVGAGLGTLGLWLGWHHAPVERELRMSQKIFYFHAPLGIWALLVSIVAAVAAARYLWRRSPRADLFCEACVEISVVSSAVVLVTGSLWAKPAWGEWFPWGEPRVTSFFVLLLLGIAYLIVRSSVDDPDRRARFSSVVAVVGAVDAVIAYLAIHIWNTTHPRVIDLDPEGGVRVGLHPDMKQAFLTCIAALAFVTWGLVAARYRLGRLRHEVELLAENLEGEAA